jgi:general stress protein 26
MNSTLSDNQKLIDLIKDVRVAMFTTHHGDQMKSRPMATLQSEADGILWFMTSEKTEKVGDIRDESIVNIAYADPGQNLYLSVSGRATAVRDLEKQKELWNPYAKVWFEGPEDPNIVLLRVTVDEAEYWDGPSNKMASLFALVKAVVTGDDSNLAENETLNIR